MQLSELTIKIMPKLHKLLNMINDDALIRIEIDEAWDNAILLTFQTYNGAIYDANDIYQMRAIIGKDRIIYENAISGVDVRDFLDDEIEIKKYDAIMNL